MSRKAQNLLAAEMYRALVKIENRLATLELLAAGLFAVVAIHVLAQMIGWTPAAVIALVGSSFCAVWGRHIFKMNDPLEGRSLWQIEDDLNRQDAPDFLWPHPTEKPHDMPR